MVLFSDLYTGSKEIPEAEKKRNKMIKPKKQYNLLLPAEESYLTGSQLPPQAPPPPPPPKQNQSPH